MRVTRLDHPGFARRLWEQVKFVRFGAQWRRWRRSRPWTGFGEPFNGQRSRSNAVRRLIELFKPNVIVETGTFLGDTTRWLAQNGVPVVTIELQPTYIRTARLRLRNFPNVELICGDSVEALGMLVERADISRPLVYLDAHWYERNPLAKELKVVLNSWSDAVIVIDDFMVPGDPGYSHDSWNGKPLSDEILDLPSDATLAYPATPSESESGARRGAAFIGYGADACATIVSLSDEGLVNAEPH